jgi:serine/threonine protein kinase
MGEVYKARDTRLNRIVAIKVLAVTLASDREFRERFDREARTISQLDHPHICALYDVGEEGSTSYLVMQYLEGETLEARLERGPMSLTQALPVAIQIADALDRAHRAGIVHRDLKPGNVMLTKAGVKLLDFGIAKMMTSVATVSSTLTAVGTLVGTLHYMAPEQLEARDADARSDIFAFGAVTYEMIAGKKAFEGTGQAAVIGAILQHAPVPISTRSPSAHLHSTTSLQPASRRIPMSVGRWPPTSNVSSSGLHAIVPRSRTISRLDPEGYAFGGLRWCLVYSWSLPRRPRCATGWPPHPSCR